MTLPKKTLPDGRGSVKKTRSSEIISLLRGLGKAPTLKVIPIIPVVRRGVSSDGVACHVYGPGPDHSRIETVVLGSRAPSPAEPTRPDGGATAHYKLRWLGT